MRMRVGNEMLFDNHDVSVMEMADAREWRGRMQRLLLERFGRPLCCFTLNVPGPRKADDDLWWAFREGVRRICKVSSRKGFRILYTQEDSSVTGFTWYGVFDAEAEELKRGLMGIEDGDRLGRLFDMDVIREDGSKISREELGAEGRKCLLCGKAAAVCARSRSHEVSELRTEIYRVIRMSK